MVFPRGSIAFVDKNQHGGRRARLSSYRDGSTSGVLIPITATSVSRADMGHA